jgi:NADPH2:quinone reductase
MAHMVSRSNIEEITADLFKMVSSGKVRIPIDQRYKLSEAVKAHNDLESRRTTGCTILLP